MSLLPKKNDGTVDVKSMWEVKLLRGIALFFVYILLVMYVLASASTAWNWIQLKWYAGDFHTGNLAKTVPELIEQDKESLAMTLINAYPVEQTDEIVDILAPASKQLDARFFFSISNNYYQLGNVEEALFWHTLARFRLRYDAVRCNYELADMVSNDFLEFITNPDLLKQVEKSSDNINERLIWVLEWDEKYPAQNDPSYFCNYIRRLKGKKEVGVAEKDLWPNMHKLLRMNAQLFLHDAGEDIQLPETDANTDTGTDIETEGSE
jgi:hypothetical protein